jgi:thiaminase/transcriptional activator TenA
MMGHRFVRDMTAGSMPPDVLRRYLIYEHDFVEAAVTIFGYALVKAPSISEQAKLAGVLRGLTSDQLDYFDRVFRRLGVSEGERYPRALPANVLAFREGMLSLAAHRSYEEIIGGMGAAEWMYHTWCLEAQNHQPADPVVAEWIALHVAAPFAEQVDWLRSQLDEHGPTLAPWRQERVARAFRRTLALEIEFHEAPYQDAGASGGDEAGDG